MYLGFCAYGPFRPFLPRKKCEKAPCTPTHIYTHRLFSFSGGLKPCPGEPDVQQSRKMYLGFCVYGPFRPFLPRKKCENGAYTHTHIYTHRLFSFSGGLKPCPGVPKPRILRCFGRLGPRTPRILQGPNRVFGHPSRVKIHTWIFKLLFKSENRVNSRLKCSFKHHLTVFGHPSRAKIHV